MANKNDLTKEDILHIAQLANLTLTDEEVEKYMNQLTETIKYVENLDELDTTNVEPTSHSTNVTNVYFEDGTENTRQFTQKEAIQNAKNIKNDQFVVKRIMEE